LRHHAPRLLALVAFVFWVAVILSRHQDTVLSCRKQLPKALSPESKLFGRAFLSLLHCPGLSVKPHRDPYDRNRVQCTGGTRVYPHPTDCRDLRRPGYPPGHLPQAGTQRPRRRPQYLPDGVRGWRGTLWTLFIYWPSRKNGYSVYRHP